MSVTAVPLQPLKKGSVAKLWIALGALALAAGGIAWAGTAAQQATVTESGLRFRVIQEGAGESPGPNDLVLVEYEGRLADGTVFDASARHGGPQPLTVSGVVPGWTEALQMMKKGGRYRIWLPPELGYGASGAGGGAIPPNATLEFDIHLVDVATEAQVRAMQQQQMQQMQQMEQLQEQLRGGGEGQPEGR